MGLKSRNKQDKLERIADLHKELVKSIFKKVPVLEEAEDIYIPKGMFELLTDEEFVVLWTLPNLVIRVSKNAATYLEERRTLLGLKRETQSAVLKSNADKKYPT